MPVRVLVVDDSDFFIKRIRDILNAHPDIEVAGTASNGQEAIDQVKALKPDAITMDQMMPVMDGVSAVREIMAVSPTPILMFSSLTYESAKITLDALSAGAVGYLTKNLDSVKLGGMNGPTVLQEKILAISKHRHTAGNNPKKSNTLRVNISDKPKIKKSTSSTITVPEKLRLITIGASTGGPVALEKMLKSLPENFRYPLLLIQHMPGTFTGAYAKRLNQECQISVKEAQDGDAVLPGRALLAPGGKQMLLSEDGSKVRIIDSKPTITYKPSVDITFGSAARALKGKVLALILTGMGKDGTEGSKLLKQEGSCVWSQDESSSVVYGMPMAVAEAGYTDLIDSLDGLTEKLKSLR